MRALDWLNFWLCRLIFYGGYNIGLLAARLNCQIAVNVEELARRSRLALESL